MKAKKSKAKNTMAAPVSDIPENVTLADVLAEVRRGCADIAEAVGKVETAVRDRLESIRRIMFYIPEVADGVKASKDKKAQADKAAEPSEN